MTIYPSVSNRSEDVSSLILPIQSDTDAFVQMLKPSRASPWAMEFDPFRVREREIARTPTGSHSKAMGATHGPVKSVNKLVKIDTPHAAR